MIPVWDAAVVLHWTLVLSVATAWLTRHSPVAGMSGWATALAVVVTRTIWGFTDRVTHASMTSSVPLR
jgi:hypothetical protein